MSAQANASEIDPQSLIPPRDRMPPYAQRGNFESAGAGFVRASRRAGMSTSDRVLDLGCGVGRFAVGYAAVADAGASYVGIDTSEDAIAVCREYIGAKLPRFTFQHVDVFNGMYNRSALSTASATRLPFANGTFDFVFSNSLFTHLLLEDFRNYMLEIGRVLRPGGRTLNTMFLLNDDSLERLDGGTAPYPVPHVVSEDPLVRIRNLDRPEGVVAVDEGFVRELSASAGLTVEEPIRYGSWCGRTSSGPGFGTKDILVGVRR